MLRAILLKMELIRVNGNVYIKGRMQVLIIWANFYFFFFFFLTAMKGYHAYINGHHNLSVRITT